MQDQAIYGAKMMQPGLTAADTEENNLRPQHLEDYIGAGKGQAEPEGLPGGGPPPGRGHGPCAALRPSGPGQDHPGGIIANEMGVQIRITSGPAIEKPGDLAALLTNLQEGDVLFIDEIHRLSRQVEEVLYPALEDYALDIIIGKGPSAQSIRINLPHFTLVGATTRAGQLTGPLRDRFGVLLKLELYSPDELAQIIRRSAGILDQPITPRGCLRAGQTQPGHPPVWPTAFSRRVRDFATVLGDGVIDREVCLMALRRMDVDELGLGRAGPQPAAGHHRDVRRRAGGPGDPGRCAGGGGRHPGGPVRALSDADGLPHPYPAGPLRHPSGLPASGDAPARGPFPLRTAASRVCFDRFDILF